METVIKTKHSVVLTEKDVQMVTAISNGSTVGKTAERLKTSPRTIEGKIQELKRKYKCKNATHLACHFIRLGIIK